jgi:hypothetical protein
MRVNVMSDPETSEKQRQSGQWQGDPRQSKRMPFDTSELDRIPAATEDDPPYRNWWVNDER